MGLINNDSFKFDSGATASQTYMKISGAAFMLQDPASATGYVAKTTLETYYNKDARDAGKTPMQIEDLVLPVDPRGVYAVIFNGLKQKFSNTTDVLDEDPGTTATEQTAAATDSATPTPAAATEQPAEPAAASTEPAAANTESSAPA